MGAEGVWEGGSEGGDGSRTVEGNGGEVEGGIGEGVKGVGGGEGGICVVVAGESEEGADQGVMHSSGVDVIFHMRAASRPSQSCRENSISKEKGLRIRSPDDVELYGSGGERRANLHLVREKSMLPPCIDRPRETFR